MVDFRCVDAGARVGDVSMKIYVLMLLISMIVAFSYWAQSDEGSVTESA